MLSSRCAYMTIAGALLAPATPGNVRSMCRSKLKKRAAGARVHKSHPTVRQRAFCVGAFATKVVCGCVAAVLVPVATRQIAVCDPQSNHQ